MEEDWCKDEDMFVDCVSLISGRTNPRDSLRFSQYTIYHSAVNLFPEDEEHTMEHEDTVLFTDSPVPSSPKGCTATFHDGVKSVDFVLAWLQHPAKSPARGVLPEESEDSKRKSRTRKKFEDGLEAEGLELERESLPLDKGAKIHFVKIHAPIPVLKSYCEILKMRMPMRQVPEDASESDEDPTAGEIIITEVKSFFSKLLSLEVPEQKFKLTAEYSKHKSYLFNEDSPDFFTGQVRTLVVDFILERTKFYEDEDMTQGENASCEGARKKTRSCVGVHKLISDGVYTAAYPLHDGSKDQKSTLRKFLLEEWAQVRHWARFQPIDHIRDYFGVKYALYFAWLGFYTHMLIPASIVGLLVFLYGCVTVYYDKLSNDICEANITMCPLCDRTCDYWDLADTCKYAKATYLFDNSLTVVFAVFMSFWATLFLELWKRYSASIVHRWGLTDYCPQSEPPRAEYLARLSALRVTKERPNAFTGVAEPYVPFWKVRFPARLLSYSIILLLISVAVAAVFGVILYRMSVFASMSYSQDSEWATSYAIVFIPATAALINLACTMTLNWVYDKLAVYLTELELHRSQTEFDQALTVKIYLFQFVNYYTSIMYIAFIKGKWVGYPAKYNRIFGYRQEECMPGGCLMELCIQLAVIMVGQQIYNGVIEMLVPALIKWFNSIKLKAGLDRRSESQEALDRYSCQWTEDYKLLDWGPRGLFYEYLEMVMQYGFVTIFVTAFPLAPFFALLNNVFEMRLDAKKFLKYYRRPVPRRAPDIGVWFSILNVLGKLAVISNAMIIAFSSNFVPKLVYQMTVSQDRTENGYLDHSLAFFDTGDFALNRGPKSPAHNASMCRYWEYREPPGVSDPSRKYKRPSIYWHVLAARLAFIVIFQNVVSLVMIAVQWCIPDVPSKLRDQIKREAYLTNEMIIKHETARIVSMDQNHGGTGDFIESEKAPEPPKAAPRRRVHLNDIELQERHNL